MSSFTCGRREARAASVRGESLRCSTMKSNAVTPESSVCVRRSVSGHEAFPEKRSYGYGRTAGSREELTDAIVRLVRRQVLPNLRHGLSAAVYTQLSDVEEEVNGLFTWDRKVRKVDAGRVRELNRYVGRLFEESL